MAEPEAGRTRRQLDECGGPPRCFSTYEEHDAENGKIGHRDDTAREPRRGPREREQYADWCPQDRRLE